MCAVQYNDADASTPNVQQYLIVTNKLKHYKSKRDYFECFSGGRANHRRNMLKVPYGSDKSMDWGVTLSTHKNSTSTSISAVNTRNEDVWLKLEVWGNDVIMTPKPPVERVVRAMESQDLITVSLVPNATEPTMNWRWRAEPVLYKQASSDKQISSNGVTLSIVHRPKYSLFTVFNDRHDTDTPIYLWMDIEPMPGTRWDNLIISRHRPMKIKVLPRQKKTFLKIRPKDLTQPWLYTFTYKWQAGSSPTEIFGTK